MCAEKSKRILMIYVFKSIILNISICHNSEYYTQVQQKSHVSERFATTQTFCLLKTDKAYALQS